MSIGKDTKHESSVDNTIYWCVFLNTKEDVHPIKDILKHPCGAVSRSYVK